MNEPPGVLQHRARKTPGSEYPDSPPAVGPSIEVLFLTINREIADRSSAPYKDRIVTSQILYQPGLLAIARALFEGTRWMIHHEREIVRTVPFPPTPGLADWEDPLLNTWNMKNAAPAPEGVSFYCFDNTYDFSASRFETLQEEFLQHLISHEVLKIVHNPALNIRQEFDESGRAFSKRCLEKARQDMEKELKRLEETLSRLKNRLTERLDREVRELGPENLEANIRAESNTYADRRVDPNTEMEIRQGLANIDEIRKEMDELEKVREEKLQQFDEKVRSMAQERQTDLARLNHGNVQILRFSLVWLPFVELILQEEDHRHSLIIRGF